MLLLMSKMVKFFLNVRDEKVEFELAITIKKSLLEGSCCKVDML